MERFVVTIFCAICMCLNVSALKSVTVKNCGTSNLPLASPDRIVGGTDVKSGQYPWIVSLHEKSELEFEHVCGGAIINENWIVTAAHCIDYPKKPQRYQIFAGLHKLSDKRNKRVQKILISKIIIHKEYDDEQYLNDIALLRTDKPINIKGSAGYVNGICLPKSNQKNPKGFATVIGWGHTKQDGTNSDTLKEVRIPLIPRKECNEAYDSNPFDASDSITNTMICAGKYKKDSCQNDSGGPLFQVSKDEVATLIGVVSHGIGCGKKYYPGVYTNVAAYKSWIKMQILENS